LEGNYNSEVTGFPVKKIRITQTERDYYKLDNAATLFALMNSDRSTNVFRVSCTLKERINLSDLQKTLERIMQRFPYFQVTLRSGLFWKYWESTKEIPEIYAETKFPCQKIAIHTRGIFPFRVKVYFNRIAVEFHHSLTDGYGGITFLKALVADYLTRRGVETNDWGDIFRFNQTPSPIEYDYAYKRYYMKELPNPKRKSEAFKPPLTPVEKGVFHIIRGTMSVAKILDVTRRKKVTISELLTAIYLEALQEIYQKLPEEVRKKIKKPIRVAVPVNLRRIFESETMRNFTYMVSPELKPQLGKYTFEEILALVQHAMKKEIARRPLRQYITRNVRGELIPIIRIIPLFLKRLFGEFIYQKMGEKQNSGKMSNLGKINMPKAFAKEIEHFDFILAPSKIITTGCAVVSFEDKLVINFSRTVEEPEIEKFFFRRLAQLGIPVKITTN